MNRVQPKSAAETREVFPAYDAMTEGFGFVPTSFHVMAHRPPILAGFAQLGGAVLGPGTVDLALKQLVAHLVSRTTGCLYCQAHTGEQAHKRGVDEAKIAAVWEFETDDRFDDAERAALRLARDSALVPNAVTDGHFTELRAHYSDEQIVELVAVASLFGFLNRFNDTLANQLEESPVAFASQALADVGWTVGKHGE